jgi:hypothetical protein
MRLRARARPAMAARSIIHIRESTPRMTQQRELHGKAEPVGGATAVTDKLLV